MVVKIKYKLILPFIIIFTLISASSWGCADAAENINSPETTSTSDATLELDPNIITAWNPTLPSFWTGKIMGYYINPTVTPLSEIDFHALKSIGITDIYVLVTDDNYARVLSEAKLKADVAGIRTNAWVFPGFNHASHVAGMKIGVLLDVETYDMPTYIPEIQAMRSATQGVTFSLCVKPDGWDDNQYYYMIAPLCDHIVPMLYIGDYEQEITGLTNWARTYNIYNIIYPGKVVAGLQTYQSDQNITPKSAKTLLTEIRAVQPYTQGVILFRYGLSDFN